MKEVKQIRLFLSSPGDVKAERDKVPLVVEQLNNILGDYLNIHIKVMKWETQVAPDMGRPQEVINQQIGDYDLFVGIMWKRFGTPSGKADSGTEEEFKIAYDNWKKFGRPRILFYFSQRPYTPQSAEEALQWVKVLNFKKDFQGNESKHAGLIFEYQSFEEFTDLLQTHLSKVIKEWFPSKGDAPSCADFNGYFKYLKDESMYIDIRGLATGEGRVHQFLIDKLYIPLKTSSAGLARDKKGQGRMLQHRNEMMPGEVLQHQKEMMPGEVLLQEALKTRKLIIKGDPGAGKTTFLRLIAYFLCRKRLGEEFSSTTPLFIWPGPIPLPIFIRLGRLCEYISKGKSKSHSNLPTHEDSPEWVLHFLEDMGREYNWDLSIEDFRCEMKGGRCLFLLDELDEAPDQRVREKISALAVNLLKAFPQCRVVLTSRPAALVDAVMPSGFTPIEIAPLDEEAIKSFLNQWSKALWPEAPEKSEQYKQELGRALQCRPEIRKMARTPVMLTALAVVHWNQHQLPEQRAELYESVITWLLRARSQRPGRLMADRCGHLLQKLALAMFTHAEGRQRQVELYWAAEILTSEFAPNKDYSGLEQANCFLRDEMIDSGLIVERSNQLEFWHLSFQEYLAACEIAGLLEKEQIKLLFQDERLYSPEWRELVLLLGGILYKQGKKKINYLLDAIIDKGPKKGDQKNLPHLAGKVGLLGSIVQDLSPFNFTPSNSAYAEIVQKVMGIFDQTTYRSIPVKVRCQAADALGRVGDPRLSNDPMVFIPGGTFFMGAQSKNESKQNFDKNAYDDNESPVHQVKLSSFYISKYPITVGQFARFIEDGGYENEHYWKNGGFSQFKKPDKWEEQQQYPSRPVVYVSWYEAAVYAAWSGGRLPTEAEWERVARGPDQEYRKYPWGNEEPEGETANFSKSGIGKVSPVGIFPKSCSPEGVIDMAGNIWEWCRDWYSEDYYRACAKEGVVKDPPGPENGT